MDRIYLLIVFIIAALLFYKLGCAIDSFFWHRRLNEWRKNKGLPY